MLDELKKIGLSEHEAKVYLALLELGSATAQEIAVKSGIKRTTIYVQIEALMKMGLVTSFEKETNKSRVSKTYFRAEDPEHLKNLVKRAKNSAAEQENMLESILPGLGKLYVNAGDRPRVRFFEGLAGLETMLDEFFKIKSDKKEILAITSVDDILHLSPSHLEKSIPQRVKLGIHSKLIYTSQKGDFHKNTDKEMLRESKFVAPEKFPFSVDINIYGDSVGISALRGLKPFGIIIESKDIANSMRSVFSLAWNGIGQDKN
ncbi:MAG: helix-turn-helix domain-containing protein [bacterium]|nr:helix-turn-helix domain-containing protein [bacterium]